MLRHTLIAIILLTAIGSYSGAPAQRNASYDGFRLVDKSGILHKPADYREMYRMIGSWTVLDPKGNQMHVVFASPGAAEYYRQNKKFADGTVLVKEVNGVDHGQMTTGSVDWSGSHQVWFVLIKDSKGRFPNNPLWGNGWGWFLFKADAPDKQVATDFKKDCLQCHVPAQATDWIYVQGYPVLHSSASGG